MNQINWMKLGKATTYYQPFYEYVEVPWLAPITSVAITCPDISLIMQTNEHGSLVGSGEQSFLYLESMKVLRKGKFYTCTPCFRPSVIDDLHQQSFMKIELYQNDKVDETSLWETINIARKAMMCLSEWQPIDIEQTEEGYDLTLNGIEVGSYGIRHYKDISWVYGTGLAEPRFSTACARR